MQIELKSNRTFILKFSIPFAIVLGIMSTFLLIVTISDRTSNDFHADLLLLIICFVVELSYIFTTLFARYYKGKCYKFSEKEIVVYKRNRPIETIRVENIKEIHHYKFKFRYIITIFAGALNEGGCWKLHLSLNDGTKKSLAFFSTKDVKLLQEQLYPNLITVL